jgi:putative SOS response-associated peptidase YedK
MEVHSCTIITCPANETIAELHDRMPVILDKDHIWDWLETDVPQARLQSMLVPYPPDKIAFRPISYLVNNPAYDSPEVMAAPME